MSYGETMHGSDRNYLSTITVKILPPSTTKGYRFKVQHGENILCLPYAHGIQNQILHAFVEFCRVYGYSGQYISGYLDGVTFYFIRKTNDNEVNI